MIDFDNDPEVEDLRAQDRFEARRALALRYNPDCRDPDHHGFEHCVGEDDECERENDGPGLRRRSG